MCSVYIPYTVSFQMKWDFCFAFCQDRHSVSSCNSMSITFKVFGKLQASILHNLSTTLHQIAHCLERQMLSRGQCLEEISHVRHTLLHWASELSKSTGTYSSEESECQDALFAERGGQKVDCPTALSLGGLVGCCCCSQCCDGAGAWC